MSDSDSSELSELSSVPSEDENLTLEKKDGILKFFSKAPKPQPAVKVEEEPPRPKREPSPPHEYVLADNPDIAFIVMFRARFAEAFPKSLANFGPQEIERGVVDTVPGEHVENLLCAVLGLLLNRKQDVKRGHFGRALEDAISGNRGQWPRAWEGKNPLSGGASFATMDPAQRLTLLRTLIIWSLSASDVIKGMIQTSYKQNRHEDDLNQPLSVQPWGSDSDKRRYYLIEGLDDTCFRVYRESNPAGLKRTWISVAGDIPELKVLAEKLTTKDGGQKARLLATKITSAIPRFEATEEKRKRREYRQMRKQQFKRPEPSFSLYEGRTRGKRIKYTYSDEEEEYSDFTGKRSSRNTGTHTPAEPVVTSSGRHVKSRLGGAYGESLLSGAQASAGEAEGYMELYPEGEEAGLDGRPRRSSSRPANGYSSKDRQHIEGYNSVDEMDYEDEASEKDYGDDEEDGEVDLGSEGDDEDDFSEDADDDDLDLADGSNRKSLVVKLNVKTPTPEKDRTKPLPDIAPGSSQKENQNGTPDVKPFVEQPKEEAAEVKDMIPSSPTPVAAPLSHGPTLSPSLTFRGSPEKPQAYRPAIDIGTVEP